LESVVKVVVLSDIHGNLPALNAVLDDIPTFDSIVCCGDMVGYYPDANEVCNILRERNAFVVRGNHEAYLLGAITPLKERQNSYRTNWIRDRLSTENLSWLASLPTDIIFSWDKSCVHLRHASPWDEETYIYPNSKKLTDINLKKDEFLFIGHTHHPMWIQVGEGMILNPGSVGQPRDWNPLASYAIFDSITNSVEIRRVKYNVSLYQKKLTKLGWDNSTIDILSRRKDIL
jgi:putative phosphoesterase